MSVWIEASDTPSMTKVGGLPNGVSNFEWPTCHSCGGPMQFVAQIKLTDSQDPAFKSRSELLLIFMCQNDPGMCDDWDADSGGNAILIVGPGSAIIQAPVGGETTLQQETFVALKSRQPGVNEEPEGDCYFASAQQDPQLLGKIGRKPVWIQGDETPDCDCGARMKFIAMLEERGGGGINFGGGGMGYAFACTTCQDKGKFLWQS